MKILVVSSSYPYPVDIGRKAVLAGFLDFFVSAFGADNVTLACITADEERRSDPAPCETAFLRLDHLERRLAGAVWQGIIRGHRALQEMLLYSRSTAAELEALVQRVAPDLVLVDTIRIAQYFEPYGRRLNHVVLYLDDLYSLRYKRMLAAMRSHPSAAMDSIGTFGRFLPKSLRRLTHGSIVQRGLLDLESRLLARREAELPRQFEKVLLLNEGEVAELSRRSRANNVTAVKPYLRTGRARSTRRFTGEPAFLFLGNLKYPANAFSLSCFLTEAMPRLIAAERRAKLVVVGRGASADLRQQGAALGPNVEFLDFVDDLAGLAATSAAMVVPLLYGSGIKMKVLDALSYGLPLVSTHCGVDGIAVTDGVECLVEDDLAAFAPCMMRLLDPAVNERMSRACQRLYAEEFAPSVVRWEYARIFGTDGEIAPRPADVTAATG
jgi:glycosyltransferase involved in cell wall biosynthesis